MSASAKLGAEAGGVYTWLPALPTKNDLQTPFSTEDIENYFDNIDPDEVLCELEADHWDYILYFSEYTSNLEGEFFHSAS